MASQRMSRPKRTKGTVSELPGKCVPRKNGASHGHGLFGMRSGTHENPPERLTARAARAGEPICRSARLADEGEVGQLVAEKVVWREK